jgi:hypothetical protein
VASLPSEQREPGAVLDRALDIARGWAGPETLAVLLSGSHGTREAVWMEVDGRPMTASDIDVYALMPDAAALRSAEARRDAGRNGLQERLLELGFAAPLEVAFFTPDALERMQPRPGTVRFSRQVRLVAGDPVWLERLPAFRPSEVPREEILLLLENRAFELLFALAYRGASGDVRRMQRQHAIFKVALDLAGALCLGSGQYAEGAAARVAWARGLRFAWPEGEPPWQEALAHRMGEARLLDDAVEADLWRRTARAWVAVWSTLSSASDYDAVLASARRTRWRRGLREALTLRAPGAPGPLARLWRSRAGTLRLRLHGAAAALLIHESGEIADRAASESGLRATLARLGFDPSATGQPGAATLFQRWDRWFQAGQRSGRGQ